MDEEIIRLIPKKKKSFWRLIFSRAFLIILLLSMQLFLLFSAYLSFVEYRYIRLFLEAFSVIMVFYLFNCEMDSTAKLTWLAIIMVAPVPATIFLLLTKRDIGHIPVKKRVGEMIKETKHKLPHKRSVMELPELQLSGMDDLCRYVNRTGCFPVYDNTEATYFPLGEDKFRTLISELEKAEKFIFMEYFILDEGYMWGKILGILRRKAAEGVEVRVMYDGMCEMSTLTYDYPNVWQNSVSSAKLLHLSSHSSRPITTTATTEKSSLSTAKSLSTAVSISPTNTLIKENVSDTGKTRL